MRILHLTPGTGHFHCGNCLRDAALAKALIQRGHDATIIPLYLPIHAEDGHAPAQRRVFLGGINVYLQHKMPWFRRMPRLLTGMLDAPGLLRWSARRGDLTDAEKHADLTVAMLRGDNGSMVTEIERLINWLSNEAKPDVIVLCNMLLVGLARPLKQAFNVPIVANMHGEDGFLDALGARSVDAWTELGHRANDVDAFIAVSKYYADQMHDRMGMGDARTHIIHNGIPLDDIAQPVDRDASQPQVIGYMARMCADKGLHTLVDAYIALRQLDPQRPLRLRVAGVQLKQDRVFVRKLQDSLARAGVLDECTFLPNVSREQKLQHLSTLDVFSVPATYGEAFGLYVLEALAHGVPVVQPRHGAFPEVLEQTGGGLLCEPDDPQSLAQTLHRVLSDQLLAQQLARDGHTNVHARYGSNHMAENVERVLMQTINPAAPSTAELTAASR